MEILIELLIHIGVEIFAEVWIRATGDCGRSRDLQKWIYLLAYFLFAVAAGFLSVWIFPRHFISSPALRVVNLFVTPLLIGLIMSNLGKLIRKNHREAILLESFFIGGGFALVVAAIRFSFGG